MKSLIAFFSLLFVTNCLLAQNTPAELTSMLNTCIKLYSSDNAKPFKLNEKVGMLEQTQQAIIQRTSISDVSAIKVTQNSSDFSVTISCSEGVRCINSIKEDMSTSQLPSNAYFFTEAKAANQFATLLGDLIKHFNTDHKLPLIELVKTAEATIPISKPSETPKKEKSEVTKHQEEDEDEVQLASGEKPATQQYKEQERKVLPVKKNKDEVEDDETEVKPSRAVKKQPKEQLEESEGIAISKKRKGKQEEPTEPLEPLKKELVDDNRTCEALLSIVTAGKNSRFKEIEGKETNATTKINESKLKLKGAKRNYLSMYKGERAFIAEYKTYTDKELLLIDFEKLQTELEDCLDAHWDNTDHSGDEMYATIQDEIKDVEYKNDSDLKMPTIRIMMNIDKEKFTIFVRIK